MKANELRIGNLVYRKGDTSNIYVTDHITISCSENYLPIPLTEEWLVKFGFEAVGYSFFYKGVELFSENHDGSPVFFYLLRYTWIMDMHIKSVHQLQNIYFALTGEELTIG